MALSPETVRNAIYKAPLIGGSEESRAAKRAHRVAHGVIWLELYEGAIAIGWSIDCAAIAADQGLAAFLKRFPVEIEAPNAKA